MVWKGGSWLELFDAFWQIDSYYYNEGTKIFLQNTQVASHWQRHRKIRPLSVVENEENKCCIKKIKCKIKWFEQVYIFQIKCNISAIKMSLLVNFSQCTLNFKPSDLVITDELRMCRCFLHLHFKDKKRTSKV